jgi:transcriptional repressor of dcmA and dcmR
MTDSEQLLDIEQAARFLNVSETSLRRWTNSGRLACLRVGRRRERRFRAADLLSFMESQPAARGTPDPRAAHGDGMLIDGVAVRYGTHVCGLYDSDEGRVRQAADFLAGGCRPGSAGLLVAAPADRDRILAALEHGDPASRLDIEAGRLVVGAYAATLEAQLEWWEARLLEATGAGAGSIRVVGDIQGFAEIISREDVSAYEAEYERRIAHRFPVVTLCQYDVRRFSSLAILDALKLHPDSFQHLPELVLA